MPPADIEFDHEAALQACARGERFAFQALYLKESRHLLAVAQRIVKDRDTAHDVLQDAFLQIWQKAGTFRPELGSARGWIHTVVRHRALDVARRHATVAMDTEDLTMLSDMAQAQAQALGHQPTDDGADTDRLEGCLAQLSPDKRQCVIDAYVEGYTHEQLAERLNKPIGTVKSWIRRGLQALKECLA